MRILLTAGPTWEAIDAVRYLGNRSSGKLGLAIAAAALKVGHEVTLLLGPGVAEPTAHGALHVHRFESCADLQQLLETHFPACDVLVMAAAVADYRPKHVIDGKRPRQGGWSLELEPTPDLVAALARTKRPAQRIVAFALEETGVLQQRAADKLRRKGVDALVANPLGTMGAQDIEPTWLSAAGETLTPGKMLKPVFARWLLGRIEGMR